MEQAEQKPGSTRRSRGAREAPASGRAALNALVARTREAEALASVLSEVGAASGVEAALAALLCGAMRLLTGDHGTARVFDPQTSHRSVQIEAWRVAQPEDRGVPKEPGEPPRRSPGEPPFAAGSA